MQRLLIILFLFLFPFSASAQQQYSCEQVRKFVNKVGLKKAKEKAESMGLSKDTIEFYINKCFKGKQ